MKTVTVDISDNGETTYSTAGFEGAECLKAVEGIKKALGGEQINFKPTSEMVKAAASNQVKVRQ